ncbi:MAG: dihydroorotate dehydrogenase electron transfer subunit [Firmicutes bacterium]|nr:dihydroorotate dehydrogenase electron transfer subunit [Bacillota bacterium]
MMPKKQQLVISSQEQVGEAVFRLTLQGEVAALPGQFVQVGVAPALDPFLMRPFSVHDCSRDKLALLYRIAGRGTKLLARRQPGELLTVIGPLGKGFPVGKADRAVVVAGGMGVAPLLYLLRFLRGAGKDVAFFYGAKTAAGLVLQDTFRSLAGEYIAVTEDGSAGKKGFVTQFIRPALAGKKADLYACGPFSMLRAVAALAKDTGADCYLSLEARMACGVGACLGCVIRGADGCWRRVCTDGPVFRAEEVFGR